MQTRAASLPLIKNQKNMQYSDRQIKQTKKQFFERFHSNGSIVSQKSNQSKIRNLPLIQLGQTSNHHGFHSFAAINAEGGKQILDEALKMKLRSSSLRHSLKAEIVFNKNQYQKIGNYCKQIEIQQHELLIKRLKQLQPTTNKIKATQRYKDKTKKATGLQLRFKRHMYQMNKTCWKPYIDYQAIAVAAGQKVYFFGGRKQCEVGSYNAKQNKWALQTGIQMLKTVRFYQWDNDFKELVQYSMQTISFPINLVQRVNLQTGKTKVIQYDPMIVPPRFYHAQCFYGEYIIVSGGINNRDKFFSDFMTYNIEKNYWVDLPIAKCPQHLKLGFAKHKMRKFYSIFDNTQVIPAQGDLQYKEEGVYMFGGQDHSDQLTNKVYIVKIGAPSIVIKEPKIDGKPPKQRKNFGMIKYKSYIIIHGGRNDQVNPFVLQSISCLNLSNLNWINVACQKQFRRYNHTISEFIEDEIVILGGISHEGLNKDVYAFQIDELIEYV